MKAWRAAGRPTVSSVRAEDFSELTGARKIRRFRVYRGRIVLLH